MTPPGADKGSAGQRWRFPRGSAALPAPLMGEIQRARILEAMCVAIAEEGGFAMMAVTDILERAGMSNKTFYEHFENKDACVRMAFRAYGDRLGAELAPFWSGPAPWPERVRAALAALLAFGEQAPAQLRFLLVDAETAGSVLRAEQLRAAERLAEALREGRAQYERAAELPPLTEEMLLAALAWRVGRALLDAEPLEPLEPALVEFTLAPYLGARAARRFARS